MKKYIAIIALIVIGISFCNEKTLAQVLPKIEEENTLKADRVAESDWDMPSEKSSLRSDSPNILSESYSDRSESPQDSSPVLKRFKDIARKAHAKSKQAEFLTKDLGDLLAKNGFLNHEGYPQLAVIQRIVEKNWPTLGPITVTDLTASLGGSFTGALFSVKRQGSDTNIFIIKIGQHSAEEAAANIKRIQESPIGRLGYIASHKNTYKNIEGLPIITSIEKFFTYTDIHGKPHTIEIMQAAQGKRLYEILTLEIPGYDANQCAYQTGYALGAFQNAFIRIGNAQDPKTWKVIAHGDFQQKNIFVKYARKKTLSTDFARKTNLKKRTTLTNQADATAEQILNRPDKVAEEYYQVYFIDNELMAASLDTLQPVEKDIMYFIFNFVITWKSLWTSKEDQWAKECSFFTYFVRGFIDAYPEEKQPILSNYLLEKVKERTVALKDFFSTPDHSKKKTTFLTIAKMFEERIMPIEANTYADITKRSMLQKRLTLLYRHLSWGLTNTIDRSLDGYDPIKENDPYAR